MTDYWKSLPKKFCEICKVWFADNKISTENHERGLKHKNMVQQRLREISRNAEKKDQEASWNCLEAYLWSAYILAHN